MAIILLILHLNILLLGSGINRKYSVKLTLVAAAKEGQNNNNNNPVQPNVQCRKDHAGGPSRTRNNYLKSGRGSNIATDFRNININGRRSGGSSNTNNTRRSSDAAANNSIISGSLSGKGSQQRRKDLVRDPVATLNSTGGDRELPEPGILEGVEDIPELVSEPNINIHDGNSNEAAAEANTRNTEQTVPTEEQDLPTTMKPTESEPTNKEIVIGTWNIQSGRSTRLEAAL